MQILAEVEKVSRLAKLLSISKNCKMLIEHLNVSDTLLCIRDAKGIVPLLVCQESHLPNNERDMEAEEINIMQYVL